MKFQILLIVIFLMFFFLVPSYTYAICEGPIVPCGGSTGQCACEFCHIFVLINNIIKFILTCLTPTLATLMIVLGGFYFLTAGPSPEKISQAKSIVTATVIGLVIIFGAWVFLNTFLNAIRLASWTGTWWQINCPIICP